jgi:hypothetical protein
MDVIVPGSNINYNGVEVIGYIAINPETGEGAYMVEGIGGAWKIVVLFECLIILMRIIMWTCAIVAFVILCILLTSVLPIILAKLGMAMASIISYLKIFGSRVLEIVNGLRLTWDKIYYQFEHFEFTPFLRQSLDYCRNLSHQIADKVIFPLGNWITTSWPAIFEWIRKLGPETDAVTEYIQNLIEVIKGNIGQVEESGS